MSIDQRARLHWVRSVRRGLVSRSSIIRKLEAVTWASANDVADDVNLSVTTVLYHLQNMKREKVVERETEGTKWKLAEPGQRALTEFLSGQSERAQQKPKTRERPKRKQSGKSDSRRK